MHIEKNLFIEIEHFLSRYNLTPFNFKVLKQNKNVTFLNIYHMDKLYYLYKFYNHHYAQRIKNHILLSKNNIQIANIVSHKDNILLINMPTNDVLASYINDEKLLHKMLDLILSYFNIKDHGLEYEKMRFLHKNAIMFLNNRLKESKAILELKEIFYSYKLHHVKPSLSLSNLCSFNILSDGKEIWLPPLPQLTLQHPLYNITGVLETCDIDAKTKKIIYNKFSTHFNIEDFETTSLIITVCHFLQHISYGHNLDYYWNKLGTLLHNRKLFKLHAWFVKYGVFKS